MSSTVDDELGTRLRELFERQSDALPVNMRAWDDPPMATVSTLTDRRRSRTGLVAIGSVAAVLALIVGIMAIAPAHDGLRVGGAGSGAPVSFATPQVSLTANALLIDAEGHGFTPTGVAVDVHSDPGLPNNYTTLELTWQERGAEMRLNIYFTSDGTNWWSNEIRTYNGHTPGDWIYYTGTFFRAPLGHAFTGDVDFRATQGTGRLQLARLRVQAFLAPEGCAHPTAKFTLGVNYARVDIPDSGDGFGLGAPRLLDTTTCTAVADTTPYTLDARMLDPAVAGIVIGNPRIVAAHGVENLGDEVTIAKTGSGTTTLRLTVRERSTGTAVATADVPVVVQ